MKLGRLLLLPLVLVAASALADDKPVTNLVAVKITAKHNNDNMYQRAQCATAGTLRNYEFAVESHVPTSWDAKLKEKGITVVDPNAKKDDKKPAPNFTIEGTIDITPHTVQFYGKGVDLICFNAKINVEVKDAKGKVLKKIKWDNLSGTNKDAGEAKALEDAEVTAGRLVMHEIFQIKEIVDLIPAAKKDDFKKDMEEEDKFWKENYDNAENHKVGNEKK
jgi:hypothetical protein